MLVVGLQLYKTQYVCLLMNSVCIIGGWWQLASLPSQTIFFLSFTKSVTHVMLSDCNCLIGDVWQSTKLDLSVRSVASASWRIGNVFNWNCDVWASATNTLCFWGRWTVRWVKRCRGFTLSLFLTCPWLAFLLCPVPHSECTHCSSVQYEVTKMSLSSPAEKHCPIYLHLLSWVIFFMTV